MAEASLDKIAAQEEADRRTEWERQRLDYYRSLRYDFCSCTVDYWINILFDQQKAIYKARKNPSKNQIRKGAGIGFWENAFSFVSDEKKKEIETKKARVKKQLQAEVDSANATELKRCNAYNSRLYERLTTKQNRLNSCVAEDVEEYFTYALNLDSFSLNGEEYRINFNLKYDTEKRQLIVDYELPTMECVSRTKEWKVDKNNDITPRNMNKSDYIEIYEQVLLDLSLRVVGLLFQSDSNDVLKSIIFNGSCVYTEWQEMPTILLSFEMSKTQYSLDRVRRMDCTSKGVISALKNVRYLDDIKATKAPNDLWEAPPVKRVIPIRSSWE